MDITFDVPGMEMLRLHEDHIAGVLALMNEEGWYYYDRKELARYLDLGQDCFTLLRGGRVMGSIFTTDYGGQAWIGNIVVTKEARGMGLASRMIRSVMDRLHEEKGVATFRLGSVPLAIGLYKKAGFRAEAFTSAQEAALPLPVEAGQSLLGEGVAVGEIRPEDLKEIAAIDARYFKSDRLQLLANIYADSIREGCLCLKDCGKIVGFLMVRRRQASKTEGGFAEGPDHAYRLGPSCVLPEYGVDGFKALFQAAIPAVNENARSLGGSATMYVVFPRSADKGKIHADTLELARAMGLDDDIDLDGVFDDHDHLFGAKETGKDEELWNYFARLGFHQEYFEQVMSCTPGEGADTPRPQRRAGQTAADPEGIFATATPGDKA